MEERSFRTAARCVEMNACTTVEERGFSRA